MLWDHPEQTLERLRHLVNAKIARLQKAHPEGKKTYKPLQARLLSLGLTPETTYLFMRGHDIKDGVVQPLVQLVCERLRREREHEIRDSAVHRTQLQNELAGYQHAAVPCEEILRRHHGFLTCPWYQRVQEDVRRFIGTLHQSALEKSATLTTSNAGALP